MSQTSKSPHQAGGPSPRPVNNRWQIRLVITVPALLVLFILVYGLVSYSAFTSYWDKLLMAGVGEIAGRLLRVHMITMVALAVLAALMGLALSYTILRPIQAITQAAEMVARGQLDKYATSMPAARELGDLSRTFNSMIDTLNRSITERNRALMEGIPLGIITVDLNGHITAINPTAIDILKLDGDWTQGLTLDAIAQEQPVAAQPLLDFLEQARRGETIDTSEVTLIGGDGEAGLIISAFYMREAGQSPYGIVFNLRDSALIRDLSAHFNRTDQLAMLGTFTFGLAHELRNPLGAIKGLSQLLLMDRRLPSDTSQYLTRMVHEVDRVDTLLQELFDLSHQPAALVNQVDLAHALAEANRLARHGLPAEKVDSVQMEHHFEPMPPLPAQADRLAQAFSKIIINAYEATPPGGRITLGARHIAQNGQLQWEVRIHNTGSTIDPSQRNKIFEPFQTSKDRSSGLGLTIANQIISQNGGLLKLETGADEVTFIATFTAHHPILSQPSNPPEGSPA